MDHPTPLVVQHTLNPSFTFFFSFLVISLYLISFSLLALSLSLYLSFLRYSFLLSALHLTSHLPFSFSLFSPQPPPPKKCWSGIHPNPLVFHRLCGAAPLWLQSLAWVSPFSSLSTTFFFLCG